MLIEYVFVFFPRRRVGHRFHLAEENFTLPSAVRHIIAVPFDLVQWISWFVDSPIIIASTLYVFSCTGAGSYMAIAWEAASLERTLERANQVGEALFLHRSLHSLHIFSHLLKAFRVTTMISWLDIWRDQGCSLALNGISLSIHAGCMQADLQGFRLVASWSLSAFVSPWA